jgi:NADPH2:quinone reductase
MMMQAIFTVPGPAGGVIEYHEVPVPEPGLGEVLVAVRATAANRGELLARPLILSSNPALRPVIGGIEFAGTIAHLGAGVESYAAGDRVMGRAPASYAEYVAAPARALMPIPEGMSFAEAAAIPNVFVTAHDAIVTNGTIAAGESVMITAGSSGVGSAAIQVCRYLGAALVVATTRSPSKIPKLEGLGAHHVIDTSRPDWRLRARELFGRHGAHLLIDQVGGPMLADNLALLAIKGRMVSVGRNGGNFGECNLDELARKQARLIGVTFRTRTAEEALQCSERFASHLLEALAGGKLRPVLDRTFPFADIAGAHAYMLSDAQIGKIVLVN